MVEGRRWNMELTWSTATQSFEITQTTVYRLIDEYTTYECVHRGVRMSDNLWHNVFVYGTLMQKADSIRSLNKFGQTQSL